jgi:hypothetical protein
MAHSQGLLEAAKKHCLVANTLRVPVQLEARVEAVPQEEEAAEPAR